MTEYRGIWYKYEIESNTWIICDTDNCMFIKRSFNADFYRIDECLKAFFMEFEKELHINKNKI